MNEKSWHLPVTILALAMMLFLAFHVQQVMREAANLKNTFSNQEQLLTQSRDVQQRLDKLAVATLRLSESGNANARALVDRLKQAGITITSGPVTPAAAK